MQFLASFDVKFQLKRSQNSFSNYNDPLNNSDFIKNLRGSETQAFPDWNERGEQGKR